MTLKEKELHTYIRNTFASDALNQVLHLLLASVSCFCKVFIFLLLQQALVIFQIYQVHL
jgi:hypothetical protein